MKQKEAKLTKISSHSVRTTFSIADNEYRELEKLAAAKRVSISWVIRDAVALYLHKAKENAIREG